MEDKFLSSEVSQSKKYLSSETKIYKTERFFYQTKKISGIDKFVLMFGEKIQTLYDDCKAMFNETGGRVFKVSTFDRRFAFKFVFGFCANEALLNEKDIVFIEDASGYTDLRSNDQRINAFLKVSKVFAINIWQTNEVLDENDLRKLFYLTTSSNVNLPVLDNTQKRLVEIENQNVLVQGVAGSGKTNICLSKILYVMGRGYSRKVLYTTFSRGLLIDTKNKLDIIKNTIKEYIDDYLHGRLVFLDKDHVKATENRLGIKLAGGHEVNIVKQLEKAVNFLETQVDFMLFEDLYRRECESDFKIADEKVFREEFLGRKIDHQLKKRFEKIKDLSDSIIYKEIYGLIFGSDTDEDIMPLDLYVKKRENSFEKNECEIIYEIAKRYIEFEKSQNCIDNNEISRKLLEKSNKIQKYSLSIVDEVQDLTQINLRLLHTISLKMFCVGDALQMINPSYFNFSYLKNLMYREDVTDVAELQHNYRNNKKIAEIVNSLSALNTKQFGTHNFVLTSQSVQDDAVSNAIFIQASEFIDKLRGEKFENFTILVSDFAEKQELKKLFPRQEILTISEVKGLERDTVLLFNLLTSNCAKWEKLERINLSHKTADENSVYRYYFNLFYVGISRAKHNIFVYEKEKINIFNKFFAEEFENLDTDEAYARFNEIISKIEIDDDEIDERVEEFIKLGQFDNARFYAGKYDDTKRGEAAYIKIDTFEEFVFKGKNREAGIRFWRLGMTEEAKKQFEISGDNKIIELLDSLSDKNKTSLDIEVVKYFCDFEDNDDAIKLILDVVKQDLLSLKENHNKIKTKLKNFKEKK